MHAPLLCVCVSRFKCVAPPPSYVHNMSLLPIKPATVDIVSHTDPDRETPPPRPSSAEPEPNPSAAAGKSSLIEVLKRGEGRCEEQSVWSRAWCFGAVLVTSNSHIVYIFFRTFKRNFYGFCSQMHWSICIFCSSWRFCRGFGTTLKSLK